MQTHTHVHVHTHTHTHTHTHSTTHVCVLSGAILLGKDLYGEEEAADPITCSQLCLQAAMFDSLLPFLTNSICEPEHAGGKGRGQHERSVCVIMGILYGIEAL